MHRWAPPFLLALALSMVFVFGNDRRHFYRPGLHDNTTANNMALVGNLSAKHRFLGFLYRFLDDDGTVRYFPYNRHPPAGLWLIKLATLPFGDGLSDRLYAARLLMLACFVATAFLAYLSATRIFINRWIAVGAIAFAFAGYYPLYYSDLVAPEGVLSMLGVYLVFHGMVIFEQQGRLAQLLLKTCGALLLGWHVCALLLAFILLGLGTELARLLRQSRRPCQDRGWGRATVYSSSLLRTPYTTLGVISLAVGATVLAANLTQEYAAMATMQNGARFWDLPSVRSMLGRLGIQPEHLVMRDHEFSWPTFLQQQVLRLGAVAIPFGLHGRHAGSIGDIAWQSLFVLTVVPAVALVGVLYRRRTKPRGGEPWDAGTASVSPYCRRVVCRNHLLLATLGLYGLLWALAMRYNVFFHDFESLHYVGGHLVLLSIGLFRVRQTWGDRVVVVAAFVALALFATSVVRMGGVGHDAEAARLQGAFVADFDSIRQHLPAHEAVAIPIARSSGADLSFAGASRASLYYLAGRTIAFDGDRCHLAGFHIAERKSRRAGDRLLTPTNRIRLLYQRAATPEFAERPAADRCRGDGS